MVRTPPQPSVQHTAVPVSVLGLLAPLVFASCGSFSADDDDDDVSVNDLPDAVSTALEPAVGGDWLVYLADEAANGPGGTDLDGDGSADGLVAVAYQMDDEDAYPLNVLPSSATVLNEEEIYLAVDEETDGTDWNQDGDQDDLVLLWWEKGDDPVQFVDELRTLPAGLPFERSGGRLYYSSAAEPAGPGQTSLRYLTDDEPTTPIAVDAVPGSAEMRPAVLGVESGLLFLGLDESVEGGDRNGDGDDEDPAVLALLDGREELAAIASTALAVDAASPVFGALKLDDDGAYRAAFLVSEADQGGASLNDPALFLPAWEAAQCADSPDLDAEDDVLFSVELADLVAGVGAPLNTGIAGRDRAVVAGRYVATLSPEEDANCDLNVDGDRDDLVVRWAEATSPALPVVLPEDLLAAAELPGGALGLTRLQGQLVAAIDEVADSRDHDGDGEETRVLLGWRNPAAPPWELLHRDVQSDETLELYVGLDWLVPLVHDDRLAISFTEEAQGESLNSECELELHDEDDDDLLPAWVRFPSDDDESHFIVSGIGLAMPASAGGVILSEDRAYFRVSEEADNTDHDDDDLLDHVILMRSSQFACDPRFIGTTTTSDGPAILTDNENWGVFAVEEADEDEDLNEDGDLDDFTLRYFRI